jgi:hypothetical protein
MKTTIELSDNLLARAKERAKAQRITLRSLIEQALATALDQAPAEARVKPVTFRGKGLQPDFADGSWEKIRDAIYP